MWREAAASAFSVASAIPDMDSAGHVSDVFENVEAGDSSGLSALGPSLISSARNATGESFLMVCARQGHTEIARNILPDSEIDDTDNDGWSALLNAAHMGHVDIVRMLLEAGSAVDQTDLMGWTPLMWAVYKNHLPVVEILLDYTAHVNMIDEEDGLTPLIVASGRGFTEIVRRLLSADAQVNACDKFGSTALIWASRKGHLPVIELLLINGAELDAVGMYSSTALMLATRGNYISVVEAILAREPNVNVVDNNGLSALGMAAREGYAEVAEALIHSGSFVNLIDRFGNSILASAVRSGNANIVRMLLDKYADVNARDSENRTALHLAIDKSYMDMVLVLLEKKPNLELKNKDGETPLLRAVKSRHVALCQLLVNAGSKISATDNAGDNALHLALRARSRRLTQILLANPSDSRLLYRPNKLGQTPYSIDQGNPQPIIPLIFGPVDSELHMDTMLGYDVYSNVLADIVCEPNLTLPLTVGLYAKWGSGKSLLLSKMKDAMKSFSRSWLDGVELRWSWSLICSILTLCTLFTLIGVTVLSVTANVELLVATVVIGAIVFCSLVGIYGVIYYGSEVKMWSSSIRAARYMARVLARMKLVLSVITVHAPLRKEKDLATCPVSFLFADYHRLSSIGGEQALAKIVTTLFEAAENHYGTFAVRIFTALRSPSGQSSDSKLRRMCGLPVVLHFVIILISLSISLILLTHYLLNKDNLLSDTNTNSLIAALIFLFIFGCTVLYPIYILLFHVSTNVPKRRINSAALHIEKLRFEGFMQKLQQEVDLLTDTIHSLDAFTRSQTRLLVVVDGLDNCEQQKMVQALDALDLLFSSRPNRPFIVTLAIDPHIIISAINHNMKSALSGTELTGYDYLQNIVNMPFYLHNSALRQLQNSLREKRESLAEWKERFRRQDTFHGSHLSLRDHSASDARYRKSTAQGVIGTRNLGFTLLTDDYFSNMNPRAMKRIVNALTLTGRLMRSFEIEFSWLTLGHWVSLIEQWPFRMSWLIDRASDITNESFSLAQVYYQLREEIPKKDTLNELDRNSDNFEAFLERACMSASEMLTVGHVKRFVPCTSNLDPYLRKLIRERRGDEPTRLHAVATAPGSITPGSIVSGPARHLFGDDAAWSSIEYPLVEMKIDDIVDLVAKLDIPLERMNGLLSSIRSLNLNGLVLQTCDLEDLHRSVRLSLGDWTLLRLLIETLRTFAPLTSASQRKHTGTTVILQQCNSMNSIHENRRKLTSQTEIESDHQWLMESLQSMDAVQAEEGIDEGSLKSTNVRFEQEVDDDRASEADSTESMFGSQENLLESASIDVRRQTGTREDMMKRMRVDSIQVNDELSTSLMRQAVRRQMSVASDAEENQITVQRRRGGDSEKPDLRNIFNNGNL